MNVLKWFIDIDLSHKTVELFFETQCLLNAFFFKHPYMMPPTG